MNTPRCHQSFTDHISLYLPPFLRPALPRDLRTSSLPQSRAAPSACAPPPSDFRESTRTSTDVEGVSGTAPVSLNHEYQDSEEQSSRQLGNEKPTPPTQRSSKTQLQEPSTAKSKEGYEIALILTNSGSVARDHLALERTFLAYVRTSLVTASTGVALVQLFTIAVNFGTHESPHQRFIAKFATPLGATMIGFALTILFLGCLRYFTTQLALTRGVFPAARLSIGFIVVVGTAITATVFGVLIKGREGR